MVRYKVSFIVTAEALFKAASQMLPVEDLHVQEIHDQPPAHLPPKFAEFDIGKAVDDRQRKRAKSDRYRKAANAYWASPAGQARRKRMQEDAKALTDQA